MSDLEITEALLRRLDASFSDNLISPLEWTLLWDDSVLRQDEGYNSALQQFMNVNDENLMIATTRMETRKRILKDIRSVLDASVENMEGDPLTVYQWACAAYSFTHTPVEASENTTCVFTNQSGDVILKAVFCVYDPISANTRESPAFHYSCEFGTVVRCWNMLARFEHFLDRLAHTFVETDVPFAKETALKSSLTLPKSINYVARFLHHFMKSVYVKEHKCSLVLKQFSCPHTDATSNPLRL